MCQPLIRDDSADFLYVASWEAAVFAQRRVTHPILKKLITVKTSLTVSVAHTTSPPTLKMALLSRAWEIP